MDCATFERHEVKYLVTERQRRLLIQAMARHLTPDAYGESTVCSVYCDTPDFRLIRASLEKPAYKEKLRLRSYGPASAEQEIFLELKKKYRGVVYKRRVALPQREALGTVEGGLVPDSQIGREIGWFVRFYGTLAPAMYLSYDRAAYFAADGSGLRVTFDRNIRWRTSELSLTSRPGGEPLLEPGQSLLEIKTGGAIPLWLVSLLDGFAVRQTSFSKYGRAYGALLAQKSNEKRGMICA
jgi:hypothetical protein